MNTEMTTRETELLAANAALELEVVRLRNALETFIQPPRNLAINGGEVEGDRSAVGFVDCRRNSHTKYLFSVKSTHGNKASL